MTSMTRQELFDNYQVIRVLGEGSFGKVFLIRHQATYEQYALKKYSKYQIFKLGKQKSLIRSTRILQALSHQNIISFRNYVIGGDDQIFLIYQACTKGSLQDIKNKLNIDCFEIIKEIMYQLVKALQYLKSVAVAHRDIKPSNISFNSKSELKVIDFDEAVCYKEEMLSRQFGLAKQLSFQNQTKKLYSRRSRAASYVGTEMYMSPQMRNKTTTDQRGDIWAFGCIFYELLSGDSLILDGDDDDILNIKVAEIFKSLEEKISLSDTESSDLVNTFDLLKQVLRPNPIQRLPVSMILKHKLFQNYEQERPLIQKSFKKFLRLSFNPSHPRILQQALTNDLIGMHAGKQKFQFLKDVPIFVTIKEEKAQKRSFISSVSQRLGSIFCNSILNNNPKIYYILGGVRYFKLKNPSNIDDKIYIQYGNIDSVSIVGSQISIIQSLDNYQPVCIKKYSIQHITRDGLELGKLCNLLNIILKD